MTVKQLIELLQTMPEDAKVQCRDHYGSWDDITWYDLHTVKLQHYDNIVGGILSDVEHHQKAVVVVDLKDV